MASETTHNYIRTIGIIVAILFSLMSFASSYVTKDTFKEFKTGTISAIIARLEKIEDKQDKVLDFLEINHVPDKHIP